MTVQHPANPACSVRQHAEAVKSAAAALGFDACGIAAADNVDPEDRLGAWLALGYNAHMTWLARNKQVRQDIRLRLPGAKSVVVVARNYYARDPECGDPPHSRTGRVARYARGHDYHQVLAKPLRLLASRIAEMGEEIRCYCSIDTGPVLEKAWAQRAGIGWLGKNGLILSEGLGSWFFLGIIATTLELAPDPPALDRCGACTHCIDACPTRAIVAPRVLDARRCISYLTIEHRGPVPADLASNFGDRLFGCDACQDACPWNANAKPTTEPAFSPKGMDIDLGELLRMDEETFNRRFDGSPIRRATWAGMRHNAEILRKNSDT